MDDRLRLIQYLYEEDGDETTLPRRLSEDETLRREYERLQETKAHLDRRPSSRPDPAVVDRVVAAARTAARDPSDSPHAAEDRPARPPARPWRLRLQAASATLALLLVVGLGWWQRPGATEEAPSTTAAEDTRGTALDGARGEAQSGTPSALGGGALEAEAVPAWDDRDELVRIHRRIERLQARSAPDGWGGLQTVSQSGP